MHPEVDLIGTVTDELFWDPKVHSERIAVEAHDGKVILRGTVGSPREKHEARRAAERVHGVVEVQNDLEVRLMDDQKRADAEIRADVLQALALDGVVPPTIDANVKDGVVTLTGTAGWQHQRDEAVYIASSIVGALDVADEIQLAHPTPSPEGIRELIERAWRRNASLEADHLSIETASGTVTIGGAVRSWVEHDEAIEAAWAVPGVRQVHDQLNVVY
jgi:osmotically-inducible protein OsmY